MAKTTTETVTKTATKAANSKTKTDKPKREPSAYQTFCKENMKKWNEENPGRAKEAMTQIALLWKDAPENPNRGQGTKARKPRAPKAPKAAAEPKAKTKSRAKKPKKAEVEDEDAENSDPVEASNDDEE